MGIVFSVIGWLIFGVIVGAVARFILPGRQNMSLLMTALLGIAGSFVGGAIGTFLFGGFQQPQTFQPGGLILSIIGAFLLVLIYSMVKARA